MENKNDEFDEPDFDLTDEEYIPGEESDVVPDYFLTEDAYEIMADVQRKVNKRERKEQAITTVWIILALLIVIAAIILYSFREFL